ncbi:MAG: hypothetical protein QME63_01890 [Actinomycetota bacterium]|nr:hypothetical protein [Actinomycetota bacterium]
MVLFIILLISVALAMEGTTGWAGLNLHSDGYFDSGVLSGPFKLNLIYLDSDTVREKLTEAYNTLAHEFAHVCLSCR